MVLLPRLSLLLPVSLLAMAAGMASAQNYPNKPIRIVTAGIGSGSDFTSRLIAQGISGPLGQQVIVENRPSGVIPGQTVAKAPPDGYMLLVTGASHWIGPLMRRETPYDPVKDFAPISMMVTDPVILVVHPSLPAKSVKELIALARARPGELNWAYASIGSQSHLSAELFKYMANVKILGISYPTTSVRVTDLLAGQTHLTIDSAGALVPLVKSGRLKALAAGGLERSTLIPDLPTVAESGLPGFESASMTAMLAPAKTPDPVINRLNQEIVQFLNLPDTKARLLVIGMEPVGSSPVKLAATVNAERDRLGKVIKAAGIKVE